MYKNLALSLLLLALISNVFTSIITSQPHDATVALGERAVFGVGLGSTLYGWKYKWYLNDRLMSYTSTLEVVATEDLQNARVYVAIYDAHYADKHVATSNTVFLRIKFPVPVLPNDFTLPASATAFAGESLEFSISDQPANVVMAIQWFIDGFPLPGQNYPQLRLKVTSELDNSELSVVVTSPSGSIRRTCLLHVYWAKWIIALAAIGGGVVLLGFVAGVVLFKRGYILNSTTNKKLEAGFAPLTQQPTAAQDPVSTELELN